jgi:hypothetical protein
MRNEEEEGLGGWRPFPAGLSGGRLVAGAHKIITFPGVHTTLESPNNDSVLRKRYS